MNILKLKNKKANQRKAQNSGNKNSKNSNTNSNTTPLTHVAIIPDGNRRWAKKRGLPTVVGHKKGAENAIELLKVARQYNIKYFTMWGLSTENWLKRSKEEVNYLIKLFIDFLQKQKPELTKNKIRFVHIGRKDRLPEKFITTIKDLENATKNFKDWHLIIGFDYGGRDEIVRATQKIVKDICNNKIKPEDITTDLFYKYTDTPDIPPVDLIIRTSGEKRISGLYQFQGDYAELYFTDTLFPDFNKQEFEKAIKDYYNRHRRFGGN